MEQEWSSFVPDLIVGIATGLVVGVVLLIAQISAARAEVRRAVRFEWSAMRERIVSIAHSSFHKDLDDVRIVPHAIQALTSIAESHPVSEWRRYLKGRDPIFDGFLAAVRVAAVRVTAAADLEVAISIASVRVAEQSGLNSKAFTRLVRARIHEFPDSEAFATLNSPGPGEVEKLRAAALAVSEHERVVASASRFTETENLARDILKTLQDGEEIGGLSYRRAYRAAAREGNDRT